MSVINQMLKDLDKRNASALAPPGFPGVFVTEATENGMFAANKKLWALVVSLVIIVFFVSIQKFDFFLFPEKENSFSSASSVPTTDTSISGPQAKVVLSVMMEERENYTDFLIDANKNFEKPQPSFEGNGDIKFKFEDFQLDVALPVLSVDNRLLSAYRFTGVGDDLQLVLTPADSVRIKVFATQQLGEEHYRLVLRIKSDSPVVSRVEENPQKQISVPAKKASQELYVQETPELVQIKRASSVRLSAKSYFQRALNSMQGNEINAAIEALRKSLELQPSYYESREMLAVLYSGNGRFVEAQSLLQEGIEINPQHTAFAKLYAQISIDQNRLQDARRVLEQNQSYAISDGDYHGLQAAVAQRLSDHVAAVEHYMNALKINQSQGRWWLGLAISLEALGRTEQAYRAYQEAGNAAGMTGELLNYIEARLHGLEGRI